MRIKIFWKQFAKKKYIQGLSYLLGPDMQCDDTSNRGREGECFDFLSAKELDTRPTLTFPLGEQSTLLPVRQ